VRVFLDENFPLGLERQLKRDGYEVEHVITIGWRGASDDRIRQRLVDPEIIFLTQDQEFLFNSGPTAIIVVSHVRQARPLRERIDVWRSAVETLLSSQPVERRFDLFDDGALVPWEETSPSVWSRKAPLRRP
jgi:hypothetical protein